MNKIKEEQAPQKKKFDWVRITVWGLFFIIIVSCFVFSTISNIDSKIKRAKRRTLSNCGGNLRNLGIIVINYYNDNNKHYPQNLEVLVTFGYLDEEYKYKLFKCPETGESYILQVDGWDDDDFTVSCPNPEKHVGSSGPKSVTASLYYHAGSGVVQVDKDE